MHFGLSLVRGKKIVYLQTQNVLNTVILEKNLKQSWPNNENLRIYNTEILESI